MDYSIKLNLNLGLNISVTTFSGLLLPWASPPASCYPLSLHLQEVYEQLKSKSGDFPQSEKAQEEVLSFSLYLELGDDKIER